MRRRRGFTVIEMATSLACFAITVPFIWLLVRNVQVAEARLVARAGAVSEMRGFSESLRADLASRRLAPGDDLRLTGSGTCDPVHYALAFTADGDGTLVREIPDACGPSQAVARGVSSFARTGDVVTVGFRVAGGDTVFRLGLPRGAR